MKEEMKKRIEHIVENSCEFSEDNANDALYHYQIWSDKPNVAVALWPSEMLESYEIAEPKFGFAKVRYPDVWNEQYGINLALHKAAKKIAKEELENRQVFPSEIQSYLYTIEVFEL